MPKAKSKPKAPRVEKTKIRFIVFSYDDDQQQWFCDQVSALDADKAAARVCQKRPYVISADAWTAGHLRAQADLLEQASDESIKNWFRNLTF